MTIRNHFFALIVLWVAIVGGLILFKQYSVRTGREVLLRAMSRGTHSIPLGVGPQVSLRYDINTIEEGKTGSLSSYRVGDRVHIGLIEASRPKRGRREESYAVAASVHRDPPRGGFFIKGTVKAVGDDTLYVKYGIEEYYPGPDQADQQQLGYGKELDVRVAVDAFGDATITSIG